MNPEKVTTQSSAPQPFVTPRSPERLYSGNVVGRDEHDNSTSLLYSDSDIHAPNEQEARRILVIKAVKANKVDETTRYVSNVTLIG